MDQISKILSELELSPSEIEVYLSALHLGEGSVQQIAHNAKLPRTTVGSILDRLKSLGLVSVYKRGSARTFWVESPQSLAENYKSKVLLAEHLGIKIRNEYRKSEKRPTVQVYDSNS